MANTGIEFGIDMDPNPAILVRDFNILSLDVRSFRVPLERSIQKVLAPSFRLNFAVGGRPSWAPLAASTILKKTNQGYPATILVEAGRLQKTAGQLNLWKISQEDAHIPGFPSSVFYGQYHQEGAPNAKIPQREFLLIQPKDEEDIADVFDDWIGERLQRTGFGRGPRMMAGF